VVGYLQDFLFSPDQIQAPVRLLSGGERIRLLLAKLFSVPSNVLVLDEPTNDLDTETLSLLEERLLTYNGTILLVSHDRAFLNNVVTSTLVFEDDGRLREYVGGYDDWLRQRPEPTTRKEPKAVKKEEKPVGERAPQAKRKLSYKEARDLETLPQRIEALEEERTEIHAALSSPEFYATSDSARVTSTNARLEALELELDEAYSRWEQLDAATSPLPPA
jgi:ATP-binding cassette subfamily F protein uup